MGPSLWILGSGDSADLGNSEKKESESKMGLGVAARNCKGKGKLPAQPEDDWLGVWCGGRPSTVPFLIFREIDSPFSRVFFPHFGGYFSTFPPHLLTTHCPQCPLMSPIALDAPQTPRMSSACPHHSFNGYSGFVLTPP